MIELVRAPIEDDVLPLTKPFVGTSGRAYTELPIPKGAVLYVSLTGYNLYVFQRYYHNLLDTTLILSFRGRNRDLWGQDAYEFRPERWFEMNEQAESPVGVYGNLYGHASCSD